MSYEDECNILYSNVDIRQLEDNLQALNFEKSLIINNTSTLYELEQVDFHIKYVEDLINEKIQKPLHN